MRIHCDIAHHMLRKIQWLDRPMSSCIVSRSPYWTQSSLIMQSTGISSPSEHCFVTQFVLLSMCACVLKYTMQKTDLFLSIWFSSIKYILMVMQLLPPSTSITFSSSQTETPHSLSNSSLFSLPPGSGNPCSVSMNVVTLGILYKWNLSFCDQLISLSIMSSRYIPTVQCVRISFLFKAE